VGAKALEAPTDERAECPALPERQPLFPASVLALLESPDVVEVLSLIPADPEDEEVKEGPGLLCGHRIRGVARVPTAGRRLAVAQALRTANREGVGWALCFDPHYAVRVSRGDQAAVFLICFWCGNVRVIGPGSHAVTYPFGWSAARLLRRELRRGGVGWLRFWRRWLGSRA
jgi:hypothetical protein